MFTGIITALGIVSENDFAIKSDSFLNEAPKIGESVSISGVCLSVVRHSGDTCWFDLASETKRCTTLGELREGEEVNIERSLRIGDRLDGHLVQGHVDGVVELKAREEEANTIKLVFFLSQNIQEFLVAKGAITINGVSLTVGEVSDNEFSVYIIPHTAKITTLGALKIGDNVNIEIDMIARYLKKLTKPYEA